MPFGEKSMERTDFWIRLAGEPLHLSPVYPEMKQYCADYLIDPTQEDQDRFRQLWGAEPLTTTAPERSYENQDGGPWKDSYLERLALYRKIAEGLLPQGILLFHGSTVALDGRAYIFTAPSGTGKSTHRRLWQERFGSRLAVINDDKPLLSFTPQGIYVYGTPYGGKEKLAINDKAPLEGILVLHQAPENTILPLSHSEAFPHLMGQVYRPKDPQGMIQTMDWVDKLSRLPVFSLGCTISQEAVTLAYNALIAGAVTKEETV